MCPHGTYISTQCSTHADTKCSNCVYCNGMYHCVYYDIILLIFIHSLLLVLDVDRFTISDPDMCRASQYDLWFLRVLLLQ